MTFSDEKRAALTQLIAVVLDDHDCHAEVPDFVRDLMAWQEQPGCVQAKLAALLYVLGHMLAISCEVHGRNLQDTLIAYTAAAYGIAEVAIKVPHGPVDIPPGSKPS